MLLTDRYGAPVGYLTIGMLETQLRTLLGGTAGAQNELLLLDARWRPVYCTQPAQTQSLADALRGQLLSGKALTGLSADVSYTVRQPVCISSCSSRSRSAPEHSGFCTR